MPLLDSTVEVDRKHKEIGRGLILRLRDVCLWTTFPTRTEKKNVSGKASSTLKSPLTLPTLRFDCTVHKLFFVFVKF